MQKDHYCILVAWEAVMCIGYIVGFQVAIFFAVDSECCIIYQVRCRGYQESGLNRSVWQRPHQDMPGIRELGDESGDMTRHTERTPLLGAATKPPRTS
jgi:hypothetical protein